MLTSRFSIRTAAFALLTCGVFAATASAARDVVIFPIDPVNPEWGGGLASYGGTDIGEVESNDTLSLTNAKVAGFVRWFWTHKPLPIPIAKQWKNKFVSIDISSNQSANVGITLSWRGDLEPLEESAQTSGRVRVKNAEFTTVNIPVPPVTGIKTGRITGLILKFEPGGVYIISSIKIVDSRNAGKDKDEEKK